MRLQRLWAWLLRVLLVINVPFLMISVLIPAGMAFSMAFVVDFAVENRTAEPIVVTPVGTVGQDGSRYALPVKSRFAPFLPAKQAGGFRLASGECITIRYDMDDINFSEIFVEATGGRRFQLVTDRTPTENQYHGPRQRRFTIDDLSRLEEARPEVEQAARRAHRSLTLGPILIGCLILVGPWFVLFAAKWALNRLG
ncbi:hypothetical protein P12x_002827 [Tundrisphaera lichenicola]|uniref:hypothetical protein n=1 Tax=Tundrisphaera lichenicola TaxID=2029860 RepID=UPI003EC0B248